MRRRFISPLPFGTPEDHSASRGRNKYSLGFGGKRQPISPHPISRSSVRSALLTERQPIVRGRSRLSLILGGVIVLLIGYFVLSVFGATNQILTKNQSGEAPFLKFLGQVRPALLQGEGDGRINILLLGIGGTNHPGGTLTDTMELVSINPVDKEVALLSIPRDLLVPIPGYGKDKINAAYAFAERDHPGTGGALTKKTVSELLDIPIHYYLTLDFTAFKELVDAIGGVTINVEKALSDPFFPDDRTLGYAPFYLKAGIQHFDGKTALKYARSRETTSDFDRARRQQQLMVAIKERLLTLGVLANPVKVQQIISTAKNNLRTDMRPVEIERLVALSKDYDSGKVIQVVLDNGPGGPLANQNDERGYYLVPRDGTFSEVQQIVHNVFKDPYLAREQARIEISNQSGNNSLLSLVSRGLTSYGYQIVSAHQASDRRPTTQVIDLTHGNKPFTLAFLVKRLRAHESSQSGNGGKVDLRIEIGEDFDSSVFSRKVQ